MPEVVKFPVPFLKTRPKPKVGDVVQKGEYFELRDRVACRQVMVIGFDPDADGSGLWRALIPDRPLHNVNHFDEVTIGGAEFELRMDQWVSLDYEPYTLPGQKVPTHWCLKGHTWDSTEGKFVKDVAPATAAAKR